MKGGVACYLHALRCLVDCGCALAGDVIRRDGRRRGVRRRQRDAGLPAAWLRGRRRGAARAHRAGRLPCHPGRRPVPAARPWHPGRDGLRRRGGAERAARGGAGVGGARRRRARARRADLSVPAALRRRAAVGHRGGHPARRRARVLGGDRSRRHPAQLEAELRGAIQGATADRVPIAWEQRTRFAGPRRRPGLAAGGGDARGAGHARRPAAGGPVRLRRVHVRRRRRNPGGRLRPGRREPPRARRERRRRGLHTLAAAYVRLALDWCGPA